MPETATQPTKRTKRQYTNTEIGTALALLKANGNNVSGTARELNIPRLTLREWAINNRRDSEEVREIQQQKEGDVLSAYATVERSCLQHAGKPEVIEKMSGLDAVKAAGIARDKQHLMLGMPTSIVEERTIDSRQVLVLLQESLGGSNEAIPVRNVTPAPAAFEIKASSPAPPAAHLTEDPTEGRFTRRLRLSREASHTQTDTQDAALLHG